MEIRIPGKIVFEHRIEDHEQLSHAGGEHDLERFAGGLEPGGEVADERIAASGGQGRHVKHASNRRASAPDATTAMELTTITIERRHADQSGDLLAIEASQFGQIHEQARDGHRTDAGHRFQKRSLRGEFWLTLHKLTDGIFQLADLFVELLDQMANVLANDLGDRRLQAVLFGRAEFDELPAARDKLAQLGLFFRADLDRPRIGVLAEAGNHARIQPIGLGQDAQAAGEVADLARIDHGHRVAGRHQRGQHSVLVAPGGFDHNQTVSDGRQFIEQLAEPGRVVLDREALVFGQKAHIQRMLGDVDTYERVGSRVHEQVPVLRMRARGSTMGNTALAAVRVKFTRPATILSVTV